MLLAGEAAPGAKFRVAASDGDLSFSRRARRRGLSARSPGQSTLASRFVAQSIQLLVQRAPALLKRRQNLAAERGRGQLLQLQGIDRLAVLQHLEVQMGPGRKAGRSDVSDDFAALDPCAGADAGRVAVQVGVGGHETAVMADANRFSVAAAPSDHNDDAVARSANFGPCASLEIDAPVQVAMALDRMNPVSELRRDGGAGNGLPGKQVPARAAGGVEEAGSAVGEVGSIIRVTRGSVPQRYVLHFGRAPRPASQERLEPVAGLDVAPKVHRRRQNLHQFVDLCRREPRPYGRRIEGRDDPAFHQLQLRRRQIRRLQPGDSVHDIQNLAPVQRFPGGPQVRGAGRAPRFDSQLQEPASRLVFLAARRRIDHERDPVADLQPRGIVRGLDAADGAERVGRGHLVGPQQSEERIARLNGDVYGESGESGRPPPRPKRLPRSRRRPNRPRQVAPRPPRRFPARSSPPADGGRSSNASAGRRIPDAKSTAPRPSWRRPPFAPPRRPNLRPSFAWVRIRGLRRSIARVAAGAGIAMAPRMECSESPSATVTRRRMTTGPAASGSILSPSSGVAASAIGASRVRPALRGIRDR